MVLGLEYASYEVGAGSAAVVAVAAVAALGLQPVLVRRRVSAARAVWIGASVVAAAFVVAVTLAPADGRNTTCNWGLDESIFGWTGGDQRTANVVLLVPLGLAITLATARSRWRWLPLPALVLLPLLIEPAQASSLVGRTCDITDVLDNWTGAAIGAALALVLLAISRRQKRGGRRRSGPP